MKVNCKVNFELLYELLLPTRIDAYYIYAQINCYIDEVIIGASKMPFKCIESFRDLKFITRMLGILIHRFLNTNLLLTPNNN